MASLLSFQSTGHIVWSLPYFRVKILPRMLSWTILLLHGFWIPSSLHPQVLKLYPSQTLWLTIPNDNLWMIVKREENEPSLLQLAHWLSSWKYPRSPTAALLLPSQFWWLFFCGLKVLAQNSVLSHLLFAQDLSLGKPIPSCDSGYLLHPKGWTTTIFLLRLLSLPGFPQTQYIKSDLIHFLPEPGLLSLLFGFGNFVCTSK